MPPLGQEGGRRFQVTHGMPQVRTFSELLHKLRVPNRCRRPHGHFTVAPLHGTVAAFEAACRPLWHSDVDDVTVIDALPEPGGVWRSLRVPSGTGRHPPSQLQTAPPQVHKRGSPS